jgi:lipopolysaccharide kinase (Kdo/WaaP) family protein
VTSRPSSDLGRGGPPCPPRDLAYYVDGLVEGRRGTLVQRQKDRSVWRVEEDGLVWFAKRGVTPKRQREIRREAGNARALEAICLGPALRAAGMHEGGQWLVLDAARGDELFLSFVARAGPVSRGVWAARRKRLLIVARGIRQLHEAAFSMPDLNVWHAFADDEDSQFIDSARLERHRGPAPLAARARDLASLLFSFPTLNASRTDRVRLIRAASGLERESLRRICGAIDRRTELLRARTRWRHSHRQQTFDFGLALTKAGAARSWPENDFDRQAMTVVRTLPDRENRTLGRGPDGKPLFFVKVFPPTKKGWSPAMRELAAIDLFQRAGILVNRVAAYAEDVDKGSMVAVKAAAGEPLDDLLRRGVTVAERRALAVQTARIWRRMRECGLRHRDAYPCHLFAARTATPLRFELRLIDLTRAGKAPFPKERWFVKDAAALWHGCPRPPVTRTDAVRWLRAYFRIDRLDAKAKRFARRVAAKEHRIAARQARKAAR